MIETQTTARNIGIGVGKRLAIWRVASLLFVLLAASVARAAGLDPSLLEMFPKSVTEIGYADLNEVRNESWFPQFAAQMVPVSLYEFDKFLSIAQTQSKSTIDQVAWAHFSAVSTAPTTTTPRSLTLALATGHFDLDAIKFFLGAHNVPAVQIEDVTAYSGQAGIGADAIFFALVDQSTIAFGSLEAVKALLKVRSRDEDSLAENESMMDEIDRINGAGIFWEVLGPEESRSTVQRLAPLAAALSKSPELASQVKQVAISARDAGANIEIDLQVLTASATVSAMFAQVAQVGLLYGQSKARNSNPDLAQILHGASVSANDKALEMSLHMNDDQMLGLIERNTFKLPF